MGVKNSQKFEWALECCCLISLGVTPAFTVVWELFLFFNLSLRFLVAFWNLNRVKCLASKDWSFHGVRKIYRMCHSDPAQLPFESYDWLLEFVQLWIFHTGIAMQLSQIVRLIDWLFGVLRYNRSTIENLRLMWRPPMEDVYELNSNFFWYLCSRWHHKNRCIVSQHIWNLVDLSQLKTLSA